MNSINSILEAYVNKLTSLEAKIGIINREGERLMIALEQANANIFGQEGNSPNGIDEPIINENNAIMLENRLTDVTKAAIKLADMKDQIIGEIHRFQEVAVTQRSLSLSNSRRSKRNSTGRGIKKTKKHYKRSRK